VCFDLFLLQVFWSFFFLRDFPFRSGSVTGIDTCQLFPLSFGCLVLSPGIFPLPTLCILALEITMRYSFSVSPRFFLFPRGFFLVLWCNSLSLEELCTVVFLLLRFLSDYGPISLDNSSFLLVLSCPFPYGGVSQFFPA